MRYALLLIALLIPALVANAQNAGNAPAFEVVSIKVRTERGGGPPASPDRYNRFNTSLRGIIQDAYGLLPFEIVGGPEWVTGSVRFDVMAKASSVPSREEMRLMVQQMLRERFALRAHMEKREMPIYSLRLSREDGRLGAKLTRTTVDCAVVECRPSMIARPGAGGVTLLYKQTGVSSSELAEWLAPYVGWSVIDRTGLTGKFDVDLAFDPGGLSVTSEGVPVFAALPEQLGLKLDSGREMVDVLVIDSADMPTPD